MPTKKKIDICDYNTWPLITTFDELAEVIWLTVTGQIRFAIVQADPGIGKSATVKYVVARAKAAEHPVAQVIGAGGASGKGLYKLAYEFAGHPIVADDFDVPMEEDRDVRSVMRALTDSGEAARKVRWTKQVRDVPQEFETTSSVLLIVNELDFHSKGMKAILSRATRRVRFAPGAREVQTRGANWASVQEVFDFWSLCLPFMSSPSQRCLKHAEDLHGSDARLSDWRQPILDEIDELGREQKMVFAAWASQEHDDVKSLFEEFVRPHAALTIGQSTTYNWVREFRERCEAEVAQGLLVRGPAPIDRSASEGARVWNAGTFQDSKPLRGTVMTAN